jgi:hypothetical protein
MMTRAGFSIRTGARFGFFLVEADCFGGVGTQSAVVFNGGTVALAPERAKIGPINRGLRALGVHANAGMGEFETVRLGRCRHMEDWTADLRP